MIYPMKKILTLIALTVFFFSSAYAQRMYDSNGRQIGRVDSAITMDLAVKLAE
jgi:hypothetical protein